MSWIRASNRRTRLAPLVAVAVVVIASGASTATTARAQTRSGDAAMAETLFDEGKARMASGDLATACPKLAESYRLDPGSGTLTALAVCHEGQGKTASAWAEFIEVVSQARQAGRADREKFAQQHVDALAPKLSRLTVVVDPTVAGLPGVEVRRDGTVLGPAGWGTAAPVDPGPHTIEARATGKKAWSASASVGPEGDSQTVTVGGLEDGPAQGASSGDGMGASTSSSSPEEEGAPAQSGASPSPERAPAGNTQRVLGLVVGGAGVVAAGVGTYFGLQAISKRHDASSACPPPSTTCADASAVQSNDDAKSDAVAADALFGGALVAVGVGVILYLTAPNAVVTPAPTAGLRLLPVASTRGASVVLDGRW